MQLCSHSQEWGSIFLPKTISIFRTTLVGHTQLPAKTSRYYRCLNFDPLTVVLAQSDLMVLQALCGPRVGCSQPLKDWYCNSLFITWAVSSFTENEIMLKFHEKVCIETLETLWGEWERKSLWAAETVTESEQETQGKLLVLCTNIATHLLPQ